MQNAAASPTGSSGDSFVFIEMRAPFASRDQNELGSFFNGPSPAFTNSLPEAMDDIATQLAAIESNVDHWDSFIDSVCCHQDEETKVQL